MSKIGTGQLVALALLASATLGPAVAQQPQQKPNILFILALADNIGYGDIGAYGGGELRGRRRRVSIVLPPKGCG
jgi:hypothetical protein